MQDNDNAISRAIKDNWKLILIGGACAAVGTYLASAVHLERGKEVNVKVNKKAEIWSIPLISKVKSLRSEFELSYEVQVQIKANFKREMANGLLKDTQSTLAMIPTYVTNIPNGNETGSCIALDIGGSNFRVLKITLEGNGMLSETNVKKWHIPDQYQTGTREKLFTFLAEKVKEVVEDSEETAGFTFSFPIDQKSISSGILIRWTKGFTADGVVGQDVVSLLNQALKEVNCKAKINALINDTVGTMLAGSYHYVSSDCCIGLILGTGSNACYLEKISNIKKYSASAEEASKSMVINMESGNFGSSVNGNLTDLPVTSFDIQLDLESNNKNNQLFEKQISGMYLGEIVRLVLRETMDGGILFEKFPDALKEPYSFPTSEMSEIENDTSDFKEDIKIVLSRHNILSTTIDERLFVLEVCRIVSRRAAQLSAISIAAILEHIGKDNKEVVVAVDGSVFEKYPYFKEMMYETLFDLLKHNKVHLNLAKDGSGVGAALASFMEKKI